jgi:hypothetical protein
VDLSNHDLSHPELFNTVTKFIKQAHSLRMLDLANTNLNDSHLCQLAATFTVANATAFEVLSIASNRYACKLICFICLLTYRLFNTSRKHLEKCQMMRFSGFAICSNGDFLASFDSTHFSLNTLTSLPISSDDHIHV